ncbi:hypothetical protein CFAM422_000657 [Trichoderma lentiforme]|uniref:Uncharacterized protein n=1 Tax=Trichoderma lentiforme TaxID=1567552 RepID=A0A9P4XR79_9HYPO|nr:hypothetical protein CFAM422_000657 [Trichoderma lentiforme]
MALAGLRLVYDQLEKTDELESCPRRLQQRPATQETEGGDGLNGRCMGNCVKFDVLCIEKPVFPHPPSSIEAAGTNAVACVTSKAVD